MNGTICIYYSRTGNTKKLANYIKEKTNCELLEISDGIDRSGAKGYLHAGYESMKEILPKLESFGMKKKMDEYRNVIVSSPIWAFDVCPVIKSFLKSYGKKIKGKTYFVITHDSNAKYEKKLNNLDKYLLNKHEAHLSYTNNKMNEKDIDNFINKIK